MPVSPILRYSDADAALAWLDRALGFAATEVTRGDDGGVQHAEVRAGDGIVMITGAAPDGTSWVYVPISDVDALYERAREAGAEVCQEIVDQPYGSREFGVADPEGNRWYVGTYAPG